MRIGFDGKRAVQNFTGLGNYSRYIVDILCQFYPENEYVLYAPKKRENKRLDKLTKQYQQLQLSYPTTSSWKKLSSLWRVWGVTQQLEKEKIDIFQRQRAGIRCYRRGIQRDPQPARMRKAN